MVRDEERSIRKMTVLACGMKGKNKKDVLMKLRIVWFSNQIPYPGVPLTLIALSKIFEMSSPVELNTKDLNIEPRKTKFIPN